MRTRARGAVLFAVSVVAACSSSSSNETSTTDGGASSGIDGGTDSDGATSATDAANDSSASSSYASDGPDSVTTATLQVPASNGSFSTTAYIPSSTGPFPVVILSSGFFQNAAAYLPYANRLASWGVVTLLRDDPNVGETTPKIVEDVEYTVGTWLAGTNADGGSPLHGKIDVSKVGLAGHSRGGQISLLAGEGLSGKIRGVFGLDPVDAVATAGDPQARTTIATIGVPIAFIGETTDGASNGCAPSTDNFEVLYAAAASPAVAITAVNADHTMFEDAASCSFCNACTAGTASQPVVLATSVRLMTAFFARELLGDGSVGASFAGAGIGADVTAGTVTVVSK